MGLQPVSQRVSRAVSEQINDATLLQIDQDGAVSLAFLPGPVVNAQHFWSRCRVELAVVGQTQQRVGAGGHSLLGSTPSTGFTTQYQANLALALGQAFGSTGKTAHHAR
jgi:hypothetical protein